MKNIINSESVSGLFFVVVGLVGWFLGPLVLFIASFGLIATGIFLIVKKKAESGIIILLAGIILIVFSRFFNGLLWLACIGSIIVGIVIFIFYGLIKKD